MIRKYYEEELKYLYESGKKFATAHPQIASNLDIDSIGDRDPHIERLFEGFAFLTARIREKIDDSFPELTESLINLIWPQLQHEIPSLCMVEFKPRKGHLQKSRVLPKGSTIMTEPLGANLKPCSFVTTQDVNLNPVTLNSVFIEEDHLGRSTLSINFLIEPTVKKENLNLTPLKLYIRAELPAAISIHRLMTNHIIKAELLIGNYRQILSVHPSEAVTSGGFLDNELLIPFTNSQLYGKALLLDYFTFPEKFMFIDLWGLDQINSQTCLSDSFSVKYHFNTSFTDNRLINTELFRLGCTPAVNLFKKTVEPNLITGTKNEYLVEADFQDPASVTHSIISVVSTDMKTGERFTYNPVSDNINGRKIRHYLTHYKKGISGKRELYITTNDNHCAGELHNEVLSIEAWCTNGNIPREEMNEGSLSVPGNNIPDFVSFTNITKPTHPVYPPYDKDYLWLILSQLYSDYNIFFSVETLKSALSIFNWPGSKGCKERISAITDISLQPVHIICEGQTYRGIKLTLHIQEQIFTDNNDLHLFGKILMSFLSCHISINSVLELNIITRPSETKLSFNSMKGKKW